MRASGNIGAYNKLHATISHNTMPFTDVEIGITTGRQSKLMEPSGKEYEVLFSRKGSKDAAQAVV